jgi:signal transduction histidine kinase
LKIGHGHFEWGLDGRLDFYGIRGAYLWLDPSLKRFLLPLSEEIGKELFSLLVARSSSLGTRADYDDIIAKSGRDFRSGFLAWGEAVQTAGWGRFEVPVFEQKESRAVVVVRNAWELGLQVSMDESQRWGCPFLQGKILGIFSIGFQTNCWANPMDFPELGPEDIAFEVRPSDRTIESSLKRLRKEHMERKQAELADLVDKRTKELRQAQSALEQQTANLESLVAQQTLEIREQNEALLESQRELTSIMETAPNLVMNVDRQGTILFINRSEDRDTLWDMNFAKGQADQLRSALDDVFTKGEINEVSVILVEGTTPTEYLFRLGPVKAAGETTGVTLVGTDLTERRELEEQLSHANRMESVGLLAGGIAHDFNNMLTSILGSAELVRKELAEGSPVDDLLDTIVEEGKKGAALVNELSNFSKKTFFAPHVLDLNDIIRSARDNLERTPSESVETSWHFSEVPLPIKVADGQIEQVILNLALNGKEAMPDGGTLSISTSLHTGSAGPPYLDPNISYAVLTVSDTGVGMTQEVQKRVFDPFFTTKNLGEATGLGMAASYRSIKKAGGDWEVESELGRGSTFRVYLPLTDGILDPIKTEADSVSPDSKRSGTVLFVEDEESVRRVALRYLRGKGYRVVEAADGIEALEALKRQPESFDLIVTDIIMPKMTGLQLADHVRVILPSIPILFISGYSEVMPPGGEEVLLAKPFSLVELDAKVKRAIEASDGKQR